MRVARLSGTQFADLEPNGNTVPIECSTVCHMIKFTWISYELHEPTNQRGNQGVVKSPPI